MRTSPVVVSGAASSQSICPLSLPLFLLLRLNLPLSTSGGRPTSRRRSRSQGEESCLSTAHMGDRSIRRSISSAHIACRPTVMSA
ncbi:hypothetical protein C8F01DRAFT_659084 [Mycena amicta]|nr:hypothetical protein C8F01DRAFT_659084 [Mycena amicta]